MLKVNNFRITNQISKRFSTDAKITFFIPTENNFRKWIKEAINECLENSISKDNALDQDEEELNRKVIEKKLRISLVTLTDWVKRGLPSHKLREGLFYSL